MEKKLNYTFLEFCDCSAEQLEKAKVGLLQRKKASLRGFDLLYQNGYFKSFYCDELDTTLKANFTEESVERFIVFAVSYDEYLEYGKFKSFSELNSEMIELEEQEREFYLACEQEEINMM